MTHISNRWRLNRMAHGGLLVLGIAALSACGKGENEPGPGGVTVGEARALDEAAQMLEERRAPVEDLTAATSGEAEQVNSEIGVEQTAAP